MYGIIALIGFASIFAPFLFGYSSNQTALWTNLISGFVLVTVSVFERLAQDKENWEYWVAGFIGAGSLIAPYVFGFSNQTEAMYTTLGVGAIAVATAGYKLLYGKPPKVSF